MVQRDSPPLLGGTSFAKRIGDTLRPRKAQTVFTREQWHQLCRWLHNDNDERRFVIAFNTDKGTQYCRNQTKTLEQVSDWAWDSIIGRAKSPLAVAFYSQNTAGKSRWGALDFDAHDGNRKRAEEFGSAAFRILLNRPDIFIILETTGATGGRRVWAIASDFHPVGEWTTLLCGICEEIGAPLRKGVCEIFPPTGRRSEYGRAVRAPGCWNPKRGCSNIIFENVGLLLIALGTEGAKGSQEPIGELGAYVLSGNSQGESLSSFPDKRKKSSFSSVCLSTANGEAGSEAAGSLYRLWRERWCSKFAITVQGTRNDQLAGLTGTVFHQVGREMAERIARQQFLEKTVATRATLREHLKQFAAFWGGMEKKWLAELSQGERAAFGALTTDNERDAFRIVKSFARFAREQSHEDFPIACGSVAARVGVTRRGAGKICDRFCERHIIRRVKDYLPNSKAGRYVWTANRNGSPS